MIESVDGKAEIPIAIAAIKGIIGRILLLRIIVFVKLEPSSEFRISSGQSLTCSKFKYLFLNLLLITHCFKMKSIFRFFVYNHRLNRLCIILHVLQRICV